MPAPRPALQLSPGAAEQRQCAAPPSSTAPVGRAAPWLVQTGDACRFGSDTRMRGATSRLGFAMVAAAPGSHVARYITRGILHHSTHSAHSGEAPRLDLLGSGSALVLAPAPGGPRRSCFEAGIPRDSPRSGAQRQRASSIPDAGGPASHRLRCSAVRARNDHGELLQPTPATRRGRRPPRRGNGRASLAL